MIDQDCRTVRRRPGNTIIGQRTAASDYVLDDDGLAECARHPLANEARDRIRAAAGRIGNDQCYSLGIRLRVGRVESAASKRPTPINALLKSRLITTASSQVFLLLSCRIFADCTLGEAHRSKQLGPHDFRSC